MKLVLGLAIGGSSALVILLILVVCVNHRRTRKEKIYSDSCVQNATAVKGNSTLRNVSSQLQVQTFGRALTPDMPNGTPGQTMASILEDPDYQVVLPPLSYTDVLRASALIDTTSSRPNSTLSAPQARRSKSFESTLSAEMDGTPISLLHANMLAISLHDLDQAEEEKSNSAVSDEGTSV